MSKESILLLFCVPLLIVILTISPMRSNFVTLPSYLPISLSLVVFAVFLYISYKKPIAGSRFVTMLLLISLLLQIFYLSGTPYNIRDYDSLSHVEYIKLIVLHHSLPSMNDCYQCYHPPLYYLLMVPVFAFHYPISGEIILQIMSGILFIGFLVFGIKTLRLCFSKENEKYFNIACVLFIFWPSGIINSVKVGNDALLYFAIAGGMYFSAKWFLDNKFFNLLSSIFFLTVALLAKNNGFVLFVIIVFAVILKLVLDKSKKLSLRKLIIIFLLLLLSLVPASFKFIQNHNIAGSKYMIASNNIFSSGNSVVGNRLSDYTVFDFKTFLTVPYLSPWSDVDNARYVFNFFLKSSLFGEFSNWPDILKNQAILLSYMVLMLVLITAVGIIFVLCDFFENVKANNVPPAVVLVVPTLFIFLSAILCFRYLLPTTGNMNFRYVFPITIPISVSVAYFLYTLDKMKIKLADNIKTTFNEASLEGFFAFLLSLVGESVVTVFVLMSAIFFMILIVVA